MTETTGSDPPEQPKWAPVGLQSIIATDAQLSKADEQLRAMVPEADPNIGQIFGKYRIVRQIGRGGMAVVYQAFDRDTPDLEVAIKVLTPESSLSQATIARFLKEGQAISVIRHPNVVQLVEPPGRTPDGRVFLVMELLTGKPLSDILAEMAAAGQVFSWPRLVPLLLQICRALHAVHRHKIVHRDMKPSNCYCTELDDDPWHIKVLDFGIAKVQSTGISDDSMETPLTQDGVFVGTPHYAAPEIIERRPDNMIDGRADIFSLGVMMYQCLTGTLPFERHRKDVLAAIFATARERPDPPRTRAPTRDIPPEVEAIVMRAMEIEVDKRFASVLDLAAAIRATTRSLLTGSDSLAELTPQTSSSGEVIPVTSGRGAAASLSAPSHPAQTMAASGSHLAQATPSTSSAAGPQARSQPEQGTPLPPGVPPLERGVESPTSLQQVQSAAAIKPFVIAGLMVVSLLAIAVLILLEMLGGSRMPTD